jgi:two-component system, LytTR family, response regulator LytT
MNIYVIEDDFYHLYDIKITLQELGYFVCGSSADVLTILDEVENLKPDLILMDIHLNGKQEGIALAKRIKNNHDVGVIFTSSDTTVSTMSEAIETNPITYITKPINKNDLLAALLLAEKKVATSSPEASISQNNNEIYIKSNNQLTKVLFSDILFAFADTKNYTTIQLQNEKKLVVRMSITQLSKELNHPNFIQTHRAYLVNWKHVNSISEATQEVVILNFRIPLGKTFKETVFKTLNII